MSDWTFLNKHRVTAISRPDNVPNRYVTDESFGFCGMFRFVLDTHMMRCVVSDGEGWQHVSVSMEHEMRPPSWNTMCKIKDLFWEPEDVVVQFHPKKSEYVNMHPGCLHLWRCTDREFPTPPAIFVGYKT
jgi:hypothetical protein